MKYIFYTCILYALASGICGASPTITQVSPTNDPLAIRQNFIESQLGIKSTIWKCILKEGQSVTFLLRHANDPTPKFKTTLKGPREDYLSLFISEKLNQEDIKYVTFGYTGNSDGQSSTIYLGRLTDWITTFGHRDNTSWRLFDISAGVDRNLLFWCDIIVDGE